MFSYVVASAAPEDRILSWSRCVVTVAATCDTATLQRLRSTIAMQFQGADVASIEIASQVHASGSGQLKPRSHPNCLTTVLGNSEWAHGARTWLLHTAVFIAALAPDKRFVNGHGATGNSSRGIQYHRIANTIDGAKLGS